MSKPAGSETDGAKPAFDPAERARFQRPVLGWYRHHGRRFPFRGTTDPYLVLVSEAILQQTQVSRGAPAWEAFTARFPTVEALARSSPADVLRAWQGLGYDRRALNLRRAAIVVVDDLGGRFPTDVAGLERLPGVGPYTARAVASIAYGSPVGAVDTNVRRVLGRVIAADPGALAPAVLQATADDLAQVARPGDWTAALMDLGSTVCRPTAPRCDICPVEASCRFARERSAETAAATVDPAPAHRARTSRERREPFQRSRRWLRGRVLDRLRAVDGDGWEVFDGAIGDHDRSAVALVIRALADEGSVELARDDDVAPHRDALPVRARLPLT